MLNNLLIGFMISSILNLISFGQGKQLYNWSSWRGNAVSLINLQLAGKAPKQQPVVYGMKCAVRRIGAANKQQQ
jgi:hypothetical protein